MQEQNAVYTENEFFSLKKGEILPPDTTRLNLEDRMLSNKSQSHDDKYSLRFCEVSELVKFTGSLGPEQGGGGGGAMGRCFTGREFQLYQTKAFWKSVG